MSDWETSYAKWLILTLECNNKRICINLNKVVNFYESNIEDNSPCIINFENGTSIQVKEDFSTIVRLWKN